MKWITTHIFLLIIALSAVAWYPIYKYQKKAVRKQARAYIAQGVPKSEQICFTSESFIQMDWVEKHEFVYEGQMYDVVSKDTVNGQERVFALLDTAETNLIRCYQNHKDNNHNSDLGMSFMYASWWSMSPEIDLPQAKKITPIQRNSIVAYTDHILNGYQSISTPPPENLKA